ncbi:helix-turn-helix transcriptional regulator [Rapidithrix thailandica]|uniref:Helix-turn-helix transcriptional regulator n=1 Tax=Rapidithrix thailandica TaxID=413964 RepID=A0AAW9S8T0_9BACT
MKGIKLYHTPCTELQNAIEYIWYQEKEEACQALILPSLHSEIIFNLGSSYKLMSTGGKKFNYLPEGNINGINSCPTFKIWKHQHRSLGIRFKPWGLHQLFGWNAMAFYSDINLMTNFFKDLTFTQELPLPGNRPEDKFSIIEAFLLQYACFKPLPEDLFHFKEDMTEAGSIKKYLTEKKKSHNAFSTRFKKVMGISPKQYLIIDGINKSIEDIRSHPEKSLTEITYQNSFYDQAHFIKIFTQYTGMSPLQFKKANI